MDMTGEYRIPAPREQVLDKVHALTWRKCASPNAKQPRVLAVCP